MPRDSLLLGDIVLPTGVVPGGGISMANGRITGVHRHDELPSTPVTYDFTGCVVLPGAIDPHVHAYSSSTDQEGIERLTRAAAAGGVTTIIDMPYDRPAAITNVERLRAKIAIVEREAVIDVGLYGTTTKFAGWREIVPLANAGVCAFKFSTYETDPDRFPEIPDAELVKTFRELQKVGLVAVFHAEAGTIIDPLIEELRSVGEEQPEAHCWSRPPLSETLAVLKLLELAREYPVRLHIAHLTAPQGYEAVEWYRRQGVDVTAETCVQYLALTEAALTEKRALAKCNPPLRSEVIRRELWRRLLAGGVDFVTSDHAPWPISAKNHPNIFDNASGLPGVEYLLPLMYSLGVVEHGLPLPALAELMAAGPAKRFGLHPRKGVLQVGADADIAVIDPQVTWTLDGSTGQSVARWSPFDGMQLHGKVVKTFARGREAFDGKQVIAAPGSGQFVTPLHY